MTKKLNNPRVEELSQDIEKCKEYIEATDSEKTKFALRKLCYVLIVNKQRFEHDTEYQS